MKKIIIILSFLHLLIGSEIKEKTLQVINNYYNQDIEIQGLKFKIPKEVKKQIQNQIKQKFYRDQIYYWSIKIDDQTHYALMDNTIGKTMPITFLVIFNENKEVIHSSIIKYRESYGGEISGKNWLAQFIGMKQDSLYKHGKEIDGITGATISVKSFTKGISKLSLLLPYVMAN
jgi:Na+-translocating ferredoxin:NAD+ oxidoreductase RnfG subunit